MFPPVDKKSFPNREQDVLRFWREHDTYHKTLAARADAPPFVFYEGPPTANGMPHPGHCLTRAIKDLFPRYKTMRGYRCERKAGWDTHGLPVETEVAKDLTKELGRPVHSKEDIESYGIEKFIHRCQASVWRYMNEWERMTERIGFWVDLENAYVTYHQSYVESVWWSLKQLFDRGLLYKGHKIVWWWAQGGTALSAGEVGQGYRQVADPSVYVKFPIEVDPHQQLIAQELGLNDNTAFLVWTTTPWTLPSNQFVAINPRLRYVTVEDANTEERFVVAEALYESLAGKTKRDLTLRMPPYGGERLLEIKYRPPFDNFYRKTTFRNAETVSPASLGGYSVPRMYAEAYFVDPTMDYTNVGELEGGVYEAKMRERHERWRREHPTRPIGWHTLPAQFVNTETGTGIVHIAPAFGEDDMSLLEWERHFFTKGSGFPPLLNAVAPDGRFTDEAPEYLRGRWVKDCDKDIIRDLKQRGLLFHQEQYVHDYPFCWRAEEDPLIQYPRESWFIRTTAFKDAMLENNAHINWMPEHIKDGRFGKFLESNVDWALSRERFWGTPLPIWVCSDCGHMEAVESYDALQSKPGVVGFDAWERAKAEHPQLVEDLKVHKPYIDEIRYHCPKCPSNPPPSQGGARGGTAERGLRSGSPAETAAEDPSPVPPLQGRGAGTMRRVPDVIDCWYDSGAMPFAQWGYRGEQQESPQKLSGSLPLAGRAGEGVAPSTRAASTQGSSPLPNPPRRGEGTGGSLSGESAAQKFNSQFPADFISEAIDQTRGWFYSQLAISTMLFGKRKAESGERKEDESGPTSAFRPPLSAFPPYPHPFRNCIVLGLMLGEDGQKMSKSKRNYREPAEIFDRYGADALRWYFFANQPPWTSIRYSEQAIKDSVPEFLLRLWNVYSFFTIYANIDGFDPATEIFRSPPLGGEGPGEGGERSTRVTPLPNPPRRGEGTGWDRSLSARVFASTPTYRPLAQRSELDRWILSELHRTAATVVERMDQYDNYAACAAITEFVDALSNWYVRRSRDRFWAANKRAPEKLDAYWTLYECLITTAKLIAPFTPFLAESLWQNLATPVFSGRASTGASPTPTTAHASVHLCDFPGGDPAAIDPQLSERMNLVRHISSLGRKARTTANLKVRQPLARVEVILADNTHQPWLEEHAAVIAEELNVKQVEFSDEPDKYVNHEVLPNFKLLGPKLGKLLPKLKQTLSQQSGAELLANLRDNGKIDLTIDGQAVALEPSEVEVRIQAKPGWTAANDKGVVVVLATELTPELEFEGLVNDLMRFIQDKRKEIECDFTDRIALHLIVNASESNFSFADFALKMNEHRERMMNDALARQLEIHDSESPTGQMHLSRAGSRGYNPVGVTLGGVQIDVDIEQL